MNKNDIRNISKLYVEQDNGLADQDDKPEHMIGMTQSEYNTFKGNPNKPGDDEDTEHKYLIMMTRKEYESFKKRFKMQMVPRS